MLRGGDAAVAGRPVDVVFIVDRSGSMASGARIQSLNAAAEEAIPFLRRAASEIVGIAPTARLLTFSSTAEWHSSSSSPLADLWWPALTAEPRGLTELGAALDLLRRSLSSGERSLPPALVLLTDGRHTDTIEPSFDDALVALDTDPVGAASARAAIAIGEDADLESLERFVAAADGTVANAHNPQQLSGLIRVAATSVLRQVSEPVW